MLADFGTTIEALPREALFLAGKAFRQYHKRRDTRTSVLPDFFIGAHVAVRELPLLTRDTARIRGYFLPLHDEINCRYQLSPAILLP